MQASEREQIERLRAGERDALRALYEAEGASVKRFLGALLGDAAAAEDALHETFLRLFAARENLDPERPLRPYLLRVARNVGIAALRRSAVRKAIAVEGQVASPEDGPAQSALADETRAEVRAALAGLPAGLRAALLLRHDQGLTIRAVGEALGVSERTARTRLREATVLLARALEARGYLEGGRK